MPNKDVLMQLNKEIIEALKNLRTEMGNLDRSKKNNPEFKHVLETIRQWETNSHGLNQILDGADDSETTFDRQFVMQTRRFLEIEVPEMQETLDRLKPSPGLSPR